VEKEFKIGRPKDVLSVGINLIVERTMLILKGADQIVIFAENYYQRMTVQDV